ncbi:MAG TPA: hypothetical protein VLZ10_11350 [Thermodesulfobacteriota bacterium]|nr:hypothetical protein [Thermodesulfobacteriota bacterium]
MISLWVDIGGPLALRRRVRSLFPHHRTETKIFSLNPEETEGIEDRIIPSFPSTFPCLLPIGGRRKKE